LDDVGTAILWTRKQLATVAVSDRLSRTQVLFAMGDQFGAIGKEDSAFHYLNLARAVLDSSMTPVVFTEPLFRIIALHQQAGRADSVAKYVGLVERYLDFGAYPKMEVQWLLAIAGLHVLRGEFAEAITALRRADKAVLAVRDHRLRFKVQRALSIALASNGDPVNAALHADTAVKEMKMVMGVDKIRHLARTQAEMMHEKELALAEAQVDVQRGQRNLAIVGGGAMVLLLILALLLFRSARQRTEVLAAKNAEIMEAQAQLIVSEKQREAEQVRTRIARDIHDEVGSELTRISMLGGEVKRRLSTSESQANEGLDQIRILTRQVSATLSDVVWAVDPQQDTVQSLVRHAESFARRMLDPFGDKAELLFTAVGADRTLDPLVKNNVFLVLKEAVNNAVKYASADRLEVQLITDRQSYRVHVKDNGQGFDPVRMAREGNGLRNMRSRAAQLGAELSIVAAPDSGTEVMMTGHWN
jgi:signal transduction histidine kinase